ncbi:MAG TPA: TusE/DsrC/DsvC family sulfur relay protein [Chloroflexi bacterium]|nr:TusE/DsrC/DsvC family sulfur relay protein [Chloroflexota bacterium]
MTTELIAGVEVPVNEEGFLIDSSVWNREIAEEIARREGIELTETHWKIIEFCRASASENGAAPTLREITTGTGISTKELFSLFPKGPAKKVAKIAGLGKPEGCV